MVLATHLGCVKLVQVLWNRPGCPKRANDRSMTSRASLPFQNETTVKKIDGHVDTDVTVTMSYTFQVRIPKLTKSTIDSVVSKTWNFHDPLSRKNMRLTIDKIQDTASLDKLWKLVRCTVDNEDSHNTDVSIVDIRLVEQCDQSDANSVSVRFNGQLPKVVYDGQKYYEFAASQNSYCVFEVKCLVMVHAKLV
jgi:hypothetical protein